MCIIIDVNCIHKVVFEKPEGGKEVYCWLMNGGRFAIGGKLKDEWYAAGQNKWLQEAERAGLAYVCTKDLGALEHDLLATGVMKSNDQHILALALMTGARSLFSDDGRLRVDWKNKHLLDKPRGKCYAGRAKTALTHTPTCPYSRTTQ